MKSRNNFGPARLGPWARVAVAAVGAAAAQSIPGLDRRLSPNVPISYAAVLGALLLMRGKGDTLRFLSVGLILGGGVVTAAEQLLAPMFSNLALASPGQTAVAK